MDKSNNRRKVLFVASNLNPGGIQNVLSNLSDSLNEEFDLSIILDNTSGMFFEFHGEVLSLGMDSPRSYNNLIYQFRILIRRLRYLRRHRQEFDFVVSVKDSAHLPNILTRKKGGKTIIAVYSNVLSMAKVSWTYKVFVKPLTRHMYNMSDALFVTSEGVKRQLEEYGVSPSKMDVIYDGVNIEHIEKMADELLNEDEVSIFSDRPTICTLGRLDPVKGYDHLIKTVRRIVDDIPNVQLIMMGSGVERDNLEGLIRELKLENNVKMLGFVENPYKYIRHSQLFVMSSVAEGFPTVLMEAMVCGTPIISTDMESGAREILAPDTDISITNVDEIEYAEYGVLVPVFGSESEALGEYSPAELLMAQGIKELLNSEDKRRNYSDSYSSHKKDLSHLLCAAKWSSLLNSLS